MRLAVAVLGREAVDAFGNRSDSALSSGSIHLSEGKEAPEVVGVCLIFGPGQILVVELRQLITPGYCRDAWHVGRHSIFEVVG